MDNSNTREWPMLMSGPLVLASIKGTKTVTRRVPVSRWKNLKVGDRLWVRETWARLCKDADGCSCTYGGPEESDHIYEYRADSPNEKYPGGWPDDEDYKDEAPRWKPSIFMPRWACRLVLEVTATRVERLQEIKTEEFKREGVVVPVSKNGIALIDLSSKYAAIKYLPPSKEMGRDWTSEQIARAYFASSWDSLNASRGYGWDANPEVQVIEYRRVDVINNPLPQPVAGEGAPAIYPAPDTLPPPVVDLAQGLRP